MECKVVWPIKVVPGGSLCKVNGGIVVWCLVRVSSKAKCLYYFLFDCFLCLLELVLDFFLFLEDGVFDLDLDRVAVD
jgi:hypothetical protein